MELPPTAAVGLTATHPAADPAGAEPPAPDPHEDTGSIRLEEHDGGVRVVLEGEIDVEMKDGLFDGLEEAARHGRPVEVDCAGVSFIDSTGISGLAWLAQLTAEPPCLVAVPPVMYELLQLTGMHTVFRFATSP